MFFYRLLIALILLASSAYAEDENDDDPFAPIKYQVQKSDDFYRIAKNFDLGSEELLRANPGMIGRKKVVAGKEIILPVMHLIPDTKKQGIVINLAELRLYFFAENEEAVSFPISIGADEVTPTGKTKIADKKENPTWIPPASIRDEDSNLPEIVLPGPDNPLGDYALYLDAKKNYKWQGIMIHGTNNPRSIGAMVSHGCIRLYPWDIERLFSGVEIGMKVEFVNQPVKVSEINGKIYIEVHLRKTPDVVMENLGVSKLICDKIESCESRVDWQKVDDAVTQNLGVPTVINKMSF
jgi:L,D-transpeptidase ErfK/SrfK